MLLPPKWLDRIMKYTNPLLDERDPVHAKLTEGELLRFMGYMLSLSIHTGIPVEKMWSMKPPAGSTAAAPMMGRFGMTQNRFNKIRSVLRIGPDDDASFDLNEWCHVEGLMEDFNEHMQTAVNAVWLLAPDESMSAWRGKQGKRDPRKIPKLQFVKRKPEPLGAELKDLACALCGMILNMEIVKGKAEEVKPKYWSKDVGACAATTLRLSEPWFGTQRVVAGDSWFASVSTAELLMKKGLYFIGDVKTGTKRFVPKAVYDEATAHENGAWATFTTELDHDGKKIPAYCVTHRRGESIHGFIATCGTTLSGNAVNVYFEDDEERLLTETVEYELTRKAPKVLNDFTAAQPAIDRHNRYRQHILAMEKRLPTNNYSFRFFTTMLGILFTTTFFAVRKWINARAEFTAELDKLALALMTNAKAAAAKERAGEQQKSGRSSPTDCPTADGQPHLLTHMRNIEGLQWKPGKHTNCEICNASTVWVCATCTTGANGLVPICPEVTVPKCGKNKGQKVEHPCLGKHRCQPNFRPRGRAPTGGFKRKSPGADGDAPSPVPPPAAADEQCAAADEQ